MGKRDYYDVLGVGRDASKEEIKRAYRRLAKRYHPDMAEGTEKKEAEERFKEVSEAYEVLADDEKRRLYDRFGHDGLKQQVWGGRDFDWDRFTHFSDIEDLFGRDFFRTFFGRDPFGGGLFEGLFGGRTQHPRRGADVRMDVEVTLGDVAKGARKVLEIPYPEACAACDGTGAEGARLVACPECGGKGQMSRIRRQGFSQFVTITTCPRCDGRGRHPARPCPTCRGRGTTERRSRVAVEVPPGAYDGLRLRLAGKGQAGEPGAPPGDLYVVVHVREDARFRREGNDLHVTVPVSYPKATLGGEIEVPTLDGPLSVRVPPGTPSHGVLRLRGKGLPDVRTGRRGDQLVHVVVEVPKKVTAEERELLERLAALQGEAPSSSRFFGRFR
jgi:molecular chaperone DnaJ